LTVSIRGPRGLGSASAPLRALVKSALAGEGRGVGDVALVLADDALLRDLNRRYRGLDRATDVLSFDFGAGRPDRIDGDVVVSLDRMREQARRFRVSVGRELARLVVHGVLHLAGHDHHRPAERRRMRRREAAVLRDQRATIVRLDRALARPG